ncbi:alpha/beta fold hydrolase [Streptomyces sp. NPDC090106]|uniref:alpha/beta fold hydrolase n=1 Tax=Streptomyces sp. NPDC090106 TaxID=3365946 RepID=UPI003810A96D
MINRLRARSLTAAVLALGVTGLCLAPVAAARETAAPTSSAAKVRWKECPVYSDDVLDALGIPDEDRPGFREMWGRTECGTISVPLDYARPGGRHITVALTRLRAKDSGHRLGALSMNPGGPGGSGYLMPIELSLRSPSAAALNERYDLIGFDPRGVGYSTSYDCPEGDGGSGVEPPVGRWTESGLKRFYDAQAERNAACSASDPAFLTQLTTANAARDLDRIRGALGERRMNYFGVSWGTQLGAVYRSMFPAAVGRMWLDSVVSPRAYDLAYRFDGSARATEAGFAPFARWLAAHDGTYGLGDTEAEVRAGVTALREAADAEAWRFSDVPLPLDGSFVSFLAAAPNLMWEDAGAILRALTTAVNGGPAPEAVKAVIGEPSQEPEPPAGTPERNNSTAGLAYLCNEDTSSHEFEPLWREYQDNLRANPVTGDLTALRPTCAGWALPVRTSVLRHGDGSLQMSGHRYESSTPYPWVGDMRRTIGGTVFTVGDYMHGSLPFVPECAAHLAAYFATGAPDGGSCAGLQPDSDAALPTPALTGRETRPAGTSRAAELAWT